METSMPMLVSAAGMVLTVYAAVVMAAWLGQRHLMYVPSQQRVSPPAAGLTGVEEQEIETPDGFRLIAWRAAAAAGRPTLLYFHGNAGNLAGRANRFARYRAKGFGLLMLSYRGYSGSSGRPSEAANVADARLAYDRLIGEGISPGEIIVYGESLGSGVAVQLAMSRSVGAVVLDAPYTSIVDVALRTYPYLPVRPLLIDRYESDRHIGSVTAPILILHGERDGIIPISMGKALYELAREPKKLVVFPNGGHVDLDDFGAVDIVDQWVTAVLGANPVVTPKD
jgi:fermentation-respiration switch protein FrsA (DUF1100 family)